MDSFTCQSESVWSIPKEWVFQSSAFSQNHVFHESAELGVSPMAKKGASQLRSTCILRNSMKVIKTMDGAFLLLSKISGTKGIHSSLPLWTTDRIMAKNGTMICPMSCKKTRLLFIKGLGSGSLHVQKTIGWWQTPWQHKGQNSIFHHDAISKSVGCLFEKR